MKRKIIASVLGLTAIAHAEDKQNLIVDNQRLQKIAEAHKLKDMQAELLNAGIIAPTKTDGHYQVDLEKLKLAVAVADRAKDEEVIEILQELVGAEYKIKLIDASEIRESTQDFAVMSGSRFVELEKLVNGLSKNEVIGK